MSENSHEVDSCEVALKKQYFMKLKYNAFDSKSKSLFHLRADCHYKITIMSFCFHSWYVFIKLIHKKKIHQNIALAHFSRKLLKKGLKGLKQQVEQTWNITRICRKIFEKNNKKTAWVLWRKYINMKKRCESMETMGKAVRDNHLMMMYLEVWNLAYNESQRIHVSFMLIQVMLVLMPKIYRKRQYLDKGVIF